MKKAGRVCARVHIGRVLAYNINRAIKILGAPRMIEALVKPGLLFSIVPIRPRFLLAGIESGC